MRTLRAVSAVLSLLMLLAGCSDPSGPAHERARLEASQHRWTASGIDSYRMTVRLVGAWVGGAAVVEVREGAPVSVTPSGDVAPETLDAFQYYDTVEELFEVVRSALDDEADQLEVEYDRDLGIPVDVYVDLQFDWADDEHGFIVEDFRALE